MTLSNKCGAALRSSAKGICMAVVIAVVCCILFASAGLSATGDNCISQVKAQELGSPVNLTGRVVVGVYPGYFYIQCPEAGHVACGIMVKSSVMPSYSDAVTVQGTLAKDANDELYIDASSVVTTGTAAVPKAFGRNNRDIGGGTQATAVGPGVGGVNTVGVLQTTWGKASSVVAGQSMSVSDGSERPIKVVGPIHYISDGDYVRVTGIASLEKNDGVISAVLKMRGSQDASALGNTTPPAQTDPLIDLDASVLPVGDLSSWVNPGMLGGVFGADGTNPVVGTVGGKKCVTFDNSDRLKASFTAPAGITGNGDYTVVVWAYKTSLWPEMPLLSWAAKGGDPGTGAQFNYGNSATSGAATHGTDAFDQPFGILKPSTGIWHQVAVTYDGSVESSYLDGLPSAQKTKTLAISAGQPVYLGCGFGNDGASYTPQSFLSGSIASVKVYDYALTPEQISGLYSSATTTYTISGVIKNQGTGFNVQGVKVYVSPTVPASADPAYIGVSNSSGVYTVAVPPGTWNTSVCGIGYITTNERITLTNSNITNRNYSLLYTSSAKEVFTLDPAYVPAGPLNTWIPDGIQPGIYSSDGAAPIVESIDGIPCVTFDGTSRMKSNFAFPFGMTGTSDWSICAWVYNPSFDPEECVLSWAPRGGVSATGAQFNFGNSSTSGAAAHTGAADLGFVGGQPTAGQWHHIAICYSFNLEKVYVDGVLNTSRSMPLNIAAGSASFLGCGFTFDGSSYYPAVPFTGSLGRMTVYDRALTQTDVLAQFNVNLRLPKVMPLGDSITDGYNVPGGYRIKLWQNLTNAGKHLDFVGSGSNGPTSLGDKDHEGHPGWQCSDILNYIDTYMTNSKPKIVLLHIGTNDIYFGNTPTTCLTRLSTLIDKVAAKLPYGGKIYVAQIIPWGGSYAYLDANVKIYNAQIPALVAQKVAEGKQVYVVNMYGDAVTNPGGVFATDLADGVHPTAAGYDKMADIWWNAIKNDLTW